MTEEERELTAAERAVRAAQDPVVAEIEAAETDEEKLRIEAAHLLQTDNGLRPGDPEEQPHEDLAQPLRKAVAGDGADEGHDRLLGVSAQDVLALAASQIGYVETPRNRTKFGQWYGLDGSPWCAQFVSWVFYNRGIPLPASTGKGFAYTPAGAAWFQRLSRWTHTPAPGHVVFYDFPGDGVNRISHVGIVERVNGDGSITAIEGNTSSGTGGSQTNGGGVYRRSRRVGIVGYGIPPYNTSSGEEAELNKDESQKLNETWQRAKNLEAVATRDIDVLRPLLEEVIRKLDQVLAK